MVRYFKFTPDRGSGRINDKFKNAIKSLIDMGYITFVSCYSDKDKDIIKSFVDYEKSTDKNIKYAVNDNIIIWLKLNNFDDVDYWNPTGNFVQFTYLELDTIVNINGIKNVDKIVATYLNIKKWISTVDSNTARFVAFPSENKLANDIGCNSKSIQKYVKLLTNTKLLYKKNYGSYRRLLKGEEIKQNSNTVYALDGKYLDGKFDKLALVEYLKFNYQMIGDEFEPYNQPLNEHQKLKALSDSLSSGNVTEVVHTDPLVLSTDNDDKSIADMNEYELIKQMDWGKQDNEWLRSFEDDMFKTEDATDEECDIDSIGIDDYNEEDDNLPESLRITRELIKKSITKKDEEEFDDLISSF